MNKLHLIASVSAGLALLVSTAGAADSAPSSLSAADLAARLSTLRQDGNAYIRLRLEVKQSGGTSVMQVQVKSRSTKASTEIVYQVLWPKERNGEAVLLRKTAGHTATGSLLTPPGTVRTLDASQMKEPLLGSDLSYEDVIENFFAWDHQALAGTEAVGRVNCQILESKPGKGDHSSYARVRTWVDIRRLVPLRVEKYLASGQIARRIETTKVASDDNNRPLPANLSVSGQRQGSVTELDGSRIKHDVTYSDADFTPEGLKKLTPPASSR